MAYGTLTVVAGPMFGGKTTAMLQRALWAKSGQSRKVLVLKPAFDNRYAETEIVSHDGLRSPAECVTSLPEVSPIRYVDQSGEVKLQGALIVLDEVQFFAEPYVEGDVVAWVRQCLSDGHDVVAGGLDMDSNGHPFPVTASLLGMADEVIKATAFCAVCGRTARKTLKVSGSDEQVELGTHDKYSPRCNQHWKL